MRLKTSLGIAIGTGVGTLVAAKALRSRRAIDFAGRTVVIFGGSRGLGLVMAREFAADGAPPSWSRRATTRARAGPRGRQAPGGRCTTITCDIIEREQIDAPSDGPGPTGADRRARQQRRHHPGRADRAHDGRRLRGRHGDPLLGAALAILAVLPEMRERGARRIVNISSIGGKIPVPHLLPYGASKFALTGLSEGLRSSCGGRASPSPPCAPA